MHYAHVAFVSIPSSSGTTQWQMGWQHMTLTSPFFHTYVRYGNRICLQEQDPWVQNLWGWQGDGNSSGVDMGRI